jgi:hypothetical protein
LKFIRISKIIKENKKLIHSIGSASAQGFMARPSPAAQRAQGVGAATHIACGHRARVCVGWRGGGLADGSPVAEDERDQRGRAPTSSGRNAGQSGVSESSPTRWGGMKAVLRSGVVVLGGDDGLRWMTVTGGKSWSTVEAR